MPCAEPAQLEEVLVTGNPVSGPEAADEHGHRCGCGDKLLVAFLSNDTSFGQRKVSSSEIGQLDVMVTLSEVL